MFYAEHLRCAYVPLLQVARKLSNPSWKVIVSASRGQYLKPGPLEPGFFLGAELLPGNNCRHREERQRRSDPVLI